MDPVHILMDPIHGPGPPRMSLDQGSETRGPCFVLFHKHGITEEGASGSEGSVSDRLIGEGRFFQGWKFPYHLLDHTCSYKLSRSNFCKDHHDKTELLHT